MKNEAQSDPKAEAPVDSDDLVKRLRAIAAHRPRHLRGLLTEAADGIVRVTSERNAALAVVRAVYLESKAIHAAYKSLPEALRQEVEGKRR
jgi:hypothetical protein